MASENLESKLKDARFNSRGEEEIGRILDKYQIRYKFEEGTYVNDERGHDRVWYPDFHLTDLGIIIEYFGMKGNKDYDEGMRKKERVYKKMGAKLISISPEDIWERVDGRSRIRHDFEKYLLIKIKEKIDEEGAEKLSDASINVKAFPSYSYPTFAYAC